MNKKRVFRIRDGNPVTGPVIYWMSRDQRVYDNWALLYAQELALESDAPLEVVFCLSPSYMHAPLRHYNFMIEGLKEVERTLDTFLITMRILTGEPAEVLPAYLKGIGAAHLVTDFDPLRVKTKWRKDVSDMIAIPFDEVDAHNIVPCRIASSKQEFAAYTFRPKIQKLLGEFLEDFPSPCQMNKSLKKEFIDWDHACSSIKAERETGTVTWIRPGEEEAQRMLHSFLDTKLNGYDSKRNNPVEDAQSNLSPYFHFGQLSAQRAALNAQFFNNTPSVTGFLDELIVRRELADNFCFYNKDYDSFLGFPEWGQDTLNMHREDTRDYLYSRQEFEEAQTHDPLWNAAQSEMVKKGKMHGYMRMYWAKKILEWSYSPEDAMETAIHLNDKYELDGRDPNGYAGIAWAIGGLHDRPWAERAIFGRIRYMNYNGCKRKFDVSQYQWSVENYKE